MLQICSRIDWASSSLPVCRNSWAFFFLERSRILFLVISHCFKVTYPVAGGLKISPSLSQVCALIVPIITKLFIVNVGLLPAWLFYYILFNMLNEVGPVIDAVNQHIQVFTLMRVSCCYGKSRWHFSWLLFNNRWYYHKGWFQNDLQGTKVKPSLLQVLGLTTGAR